jgi:hypothetical protein
MEKIRRWLRVALDKEVLSFMALPYSLPLADLGLSQLTGLGVFAEAWPWLFAPAVGLHGLLALHVATRVAEAEKEQAASGAPAEPAPLQESLQRGFSSIEYGDGLKALTELISEYDQLQPVLDRRKDTDSLVVAQIPVLAKETYLQGLSALEDALDLARAVGAPDRQRLEGEVAELQKDIDTLKADKSQAELLKIKAERLASHKDLLEMMKRQQLRLDELLYQSDRCGASLHRARMELAGLRADSSEEGVSAVTETLRMTINHAKGVQEEMKKLGA